MTDDEKENKTTIVAKDDQRTFSYDVQKMTSATWTRYILIALIMSIGYLFILVDIVDEFVLPPERAFSFLLEEQLLGLLIPNILIILITPIIWQRVTSLIMNNQVVRSFEAAKKQSITARPMSLLGKIFGMKTFGGEHNYYLEGKVEKTDLNDIKEMFQDRILSAISSNIGFTFYIAFLINFLLPSDLTGKDALFLSIMIMQLVPLMVSWIVPVNWALKDSLIRHVGHNNTVHDMGEEMNNGILDKFIGIGGLIVGINVAYDLAYDSSLLEITNILVAAVYFIFYFLLLSSGTIVIISLLYLNGYHKELVNSVRVKLSRVLPIAVTSIDAITIDEETRKSVEPPKKSIVSGIVKSIFILVALAGLAFCMYYVLIVIGPFGYLLPWT